MPILCREDISGLYQMLLKHGSSGNALIEVSRPVVSGGKEGLLSRTTMPKSKLFRGEKAVRT